jgi:putative sigma-54 modulation protein
MQTNISAKQIQLTPAIEEYIHKKTDRIRKHYDKVQGIYVVLEKDADEYHVEVKTDIERHSDIVANAKNDNLYACVDQCVDRAIRQITDHKDRIRNHKH